FNKKMDATSFDHDSLVVMRGQFEYLTGDISFDGNSAKFAPASPLMAGRLYRVRVRSSVTDLAGNHMVEDAVWSFRTGDSAAVQQRGISLGAARSFTILAESSVSTTGATEVDGDVGLSPGTGTDFQGFSNTMDESKQFATSEQVSGRMYAAEFAPPTPVNVVKAVRDMNAAYSDAEGRKLPHSINLGDGSIDGMELTPGLYRWSSSLAIENSLTLRGTSADVWIFQISGDLDIADGAIMTLSGGASCHNVIWQVSGDVNL